jgi:hypothetical protein
MRHLTHSYFKGRKIVKKEIRKECINFKPGNILRII